MTGDTKRARNAVLATFEWIDGNASFTPVFRSAETLRLLGAGLAEPFRDFGITAVIAPEARGFILGALCATSLGVGFVAARKPGELRSGDWVEVESDPDWRGRRITFSIANVLTSADRVLIVDDWIETGSQAKAVAVAYAQRARGERSRPTHGWASLTPTEMRVAELVATGATNPQIADALLMARSTVKTHLLHIFTKLAIQSRTELAALIVTNAHH